MPTLALRPAALAPEPQGEPLVGPVTAAAEAAGVRPGMRLGEALATCPSLALVEPDAARAERGWEEILHALEDAGFAVEPASLGVAYFETRGVERLYGGLSRRSGARSPRSGPSGTRASAPPDGASLRSRRLQSRDPGRSSWSPTRSCRSSSRLCRSRSFRSSAAATKSSKHSEFATRTACRASGRCRCRTFGAGRPARLGPGERWDGRACARPAPARSRGRLARVSRGGRQRVDAQARARRADRDRARPPRATRSLRSQGCAAARLESGGSWRRTLTLREPSGDPERIRVALSPRLAELPAPVAELRLELVELTEPTGRQLELLAAGAEDRSRLRDGLRQVRASTGSGSVCTVVEVAPWSRVPESRALLVPKDE